MHRAVRRRSNDVASRVPRRRRRASSPPSASSRSRLAPATSCGRGGGRPPSTLAASFGRRPTRRASVPASFELTLRTPQPPLLCAGFEGACALGPVNRLVRVGLEEGAGDARREDDCDDGASARGCAGAAPRRAAVDRGRPLGSRRALFLVGPAVRGRRLVRPCTSPPALWGGGRRDGARPRASNPPRRSSVCTRDEHVPRRLRVLRRRRGDVVLRGEICF